MRPIDADRLDDVLIEKQYSAQTMGIMYTDYPQMMAIVSNQPTIDFDSPRPKGQWMIKHRHRGGFRRYTGYDEFGNLHTITVDERFEVDDPYCPYCGKFNESIHLNFCPNCGADMREEREE